MDGHGEWLWMDVGVGGRLAACAWRIVVVVIVVSRHRHCLIVILFLTIITCYTTLYTTQHYTNYTPLQRRGRAVTPIQPGRIPALPGSHSYGGPPDRLRYHGTLPEAVHSLGKSVHGCDPFTTEDRRREGGGGSARGARRLRGQRGRREVNVCKYVRAELVVGWSALTSLTHSLTHSLTYSS